MWGCVGGTKDFHCDSFVSWITASCAGQPSAVDSEANHYEAPKNAEMLFCLFDIFCVDLRTATGAAAAAADAAVAAAATAAAADGADADAVEKKLVIVCCAFFSARLTLCGSIGVTASTSCAAATLPAAAVARRAPTSPASSIGHLTPTIRFPPSSSIRTTYAESVQTTPNPNS